MTDQELIQALRGTETQSKRELLDEAAERIERMQWIPVAERLPENAKDVLIAFTRKGLNGNVYRGVGMAFYTNGKSNSEDSAYWWDPDDIDLEYDEEIDAYLIPEGWWETVNFGEKFTAVDTPVTHWLPLPPSPEEALRRDEND